jgi:hypothetical protein
MVGGVSDHRSPDMATIISHSPKTMHMAPISRVILKKYLVDVGLGVSFFFCFVTGIIKLPGFVRFFHRAAIDLPMDRIDMLHDGSGIVLGIFALVHLALNWKWLVSVTRKLIGRE